jgi:hypothetical protein
MEKEHYFKKRPIGLFVVFTSLREQPGILTSDAPSKLTNCGLHVVTDWNYIFLILNRLRRSLLDKSRWDIAIDATSFFLFLRIYYDSLSHLIHLLFKMINPIESQRWPKSHSFADQIKWFGKQENNPYFAEYVRCLTVHGFKESFISMRRIRNLLKTMPTNGDAARMVWMSHDWFPITGNLRNEVGYYTFQCLKFTDFLGDYFLMKIEERVPIIRMEEDHHGYERGRLEDDQIQVYKWFNTMS